MNGPSYRPSKSSGHGIPTGSTNISSKLGRGYDSRNYLITASWVCANFVGSGMISFR